MFYLKYRPQKIGEIDNTTVKESLSNILKAEDTPHAFLFVGQKGTGKTSSARIVAKSINCEAREGFEPCNKCKSCTAINSSSAVDVIEMDAASHRGIEEVRNLIRETSFAPMNSQYRVFIIDEAHMITSEAFNALLKTLEEPPPSCIFILATTNLEKVPKTIASRCFVVNFGRAKREDIISMLERIKEKEKIKIETDVLKLVARYSENSFRDAAKILEELAMQNKLTLEAAQEFLGLVGNKSLLEIVEKESIKESLKWIGEFNHSGGNFRNLIEQTLEELRTLLLVKSGAIADDEVKTTFTTSQITHFIKLLTDAYNTMKISPIESLPLEIAVAEFYNNK